MHWIVSTHYRVRATSFAFAGVLISVLLSNQLAPLYLWWVLGFLFFIYPHLAYWHARRAQDSRRAEFLNLHVDTVLLGLWTGMLGWPLWITFMLCITSTVNRVLVRGFRASLWAMVVFFGAGCLVWFGWREGRWRLAEDQIEVSVLCALGTFVYLLGVAQIAYSRTASLRKTRRELQQRVVEVESLQEKLIEQTIRDPLTGLFNRRHLEPTLAREVARCRREGRPLSVMLLDVDHFKRINDGHGHAVGDEVLRQMAAVLSRSVREEDLACRYGGEEFVLVLPSMAAGHALERAEALRRALGELLIPLEGGGRLRLTVSIGVATYPEAGTTPDHLLRAADEALYAAKHAGRDVVKVFGQTPLQGQAA